MSQAQAVANGYAPDAETKTAIRADIIGAITGERDDRQFTADDLKTIYKHLTSRDVDPVTDLDDLTKRELMVEISRVARLGATDRLEGAPQPYFNKADLNEIRSRLTQ